MPLLIPKTINGKPFTLKELGMLVKEKFPEMGDLSGYRCIWENAYGYGNESESYWILIRKDVLKESRGMNFSDQQELVEKKGQGKYQAPHAIEAAASLFMEYAHSKTRLLSDGEEEATFTNCLENYKGHQIQVGSYEPAGFHVEVNFCEENCFNGIAPVRRL